MVLFWVQGLQADPRCASKEAEKGVILLALCKAKDWGFYMIHLFSDTLEVIIAINGGGIGL